MTTLFTGPPKPKLPPPPPTTPRMADAGMALAPSANYQTLISSGSAKGLTRKASGNKRTLIGGG